MSGGRQLYGGYQEHSTWSSHRDEVTMLKSSLLLRCQTLAATTLVVLGLGAAPGVLAQTNPTTVEFREIANSLDPLHTRPIDPFLGTWSVDKFVLNATQFPWTDFHVTLQVWNGNSWVDSDENDGISFGQPTPFDQWLAGVTVDINGVIVGGWHVVRTNAPVDQLDFFFDAFHVQPGQQLSLHFDMVDLLGDNTWRLEQVPTIPEPATLALWLGGLLGMSLVAHRRPGR